MKINSRKIDLIVIMAIIAISAFLVLKFEIKTLIASILYFLVPAIYLLIRKTKDIKNITISSLFFGIVCGFLFSFINTINEQWWYPQGSLLIPYRVFGLVPIDEVLWYVFMILLVTTFYEHFIDKGDAGKTSKNIKYIIYPSLIVLVITIILFISFPLLLKVKYSYLISGFIAIIPFIYLVTKKPIFISKFAKVVVFFFFLFLTHELTAVKTGQWIFTGNYIGTVNILGLVFPFEEFFFWIMISSAACLSYYEIFIDDEK